MLHGVRRDRSRFAVIEGEPGIGKTALLDAVAERAAGEGFAVVRGRADMLGRNLPLQPVLDAVASVLRTVAPQGAAALLGPDDVGARADSCDMSPPAARLR